MEKVKRKRGRKPALYALYKGDKYLMDGTLRQIADRRGVKIETLWWMLSPAYRKRCAQYRNENRLVLVKLANEDDEL